MTRIHRQPRMPRVAALAGAIILGLALPATALAQTEKERELEARIAQLESLVQTLISQQQQTDEKITEQVETKVAEVAASKAAEAGAIQSKTITPGALAGTTFSYGGFVKLDALFTDTNDGEIPDDSAGRLFFVPGTIPVGGAGGNEKADLDVHAQFSRFWLGTNTTLDTGDTLRSYFEADLFGSALGNEVSTNTMGVTIRHAFVGWNGWLAGQTWSNFQDVAALPDTVDFLGVSAGTVFVRQGQVRYTKGPWSVSAENPRTIATPFGGGARISANDSQMPDLTFRYNHKADWGHLSLAGMVRQLGVEQGAIDDRTIGGGVSVSGKYNLGTSDDLRFMVTAGEGISRYIGFAMNNDVNVEADGDLDPIGMVSGFAAWRHVFTPKVRGNLYGSFASFDNDADLSGLGVTKNVYSAHANLIWTVLPKLDVGAELMWATRELENGDNGDLQRLQFHVKYSF